MDIGHSKHGHSEGPNIFTVLRNIPSRITDVKVEENPSGNDEDEMWIKCENGY